MNFIKKCSFSLSLYAVFAFLYIFAIFGLNHRPTHQQSYLMPSSRKLLSPPRCELYTAAGYLAWISKFIPIGNAIS